MQRKQVYQYLNDALSMAGHALVVADTNGFVSLGKNVLSDAALRDNFYAKLIDRIGRVVVDTRKYYGSNFDLRKEPFEFGAMLEKIHVEPIPAKINNSYDLTNGSVVNVGVVYKPTINVHVFSGTDTWEVPVTIVEEQIRTAFLSEEAMAAFISSIYVQLESSLEVYYEKIESATMATFIALLFNEDSTARPLKFNLAAFYAGQQNPPTLEKALQDPAFIRYTLEKIKKVSKLMTKMSDVFNPENAQRHTPLDLQKWAIHTDLATALDTIVKSTSFNEEYVSLPKFKEVAYWQSFSYDTNGNIVNDKKVHITNKFLGDTDVTVEQDGIVAVVRDDEAVATTIDRRRVTKDYIGASEMTNLYHKADIGFLIDPSEQGFVFYYSLS